MDVFHACMSFTIVHRQPSTVVMYFYSPTKTGVTLGERDGKTLRGQGIGKTELLRRTASVVGPALVDCVNDYKKFVEDDKFSAKGFDKLVTIVDDVDNPNALLKGAFKAESRHRCAHGASASQPYRPRV
jgi:hypothetical protein